jgi:energy-coupling factor transport system substrate-specific component
VGLRTVLAVLALAAVAVPNADAGPVDRAVAYVESRQQTGGGFSEPGGGANPPLSAWAVLGLAAAGERPAGAAAYLESAPAETTTDLELKILALAALGRDVTGLVRELGSHRHSDGRIGPAVNSTAWGVIALRAAGEPAGRRTVSYLRRAQFANGGWSWHEDASADTDDTAATIQALRAAGVPETATAIQRGLRYLRSMRNADGGYELTPGAGSNVQSTAWAIQAFLAAGDSPGAQAYSYIRRLQRSDGSFRLSSRYVTTPVWVTAQALAALSRKPFPLP